MSDGSSEAQGRGRRDGSPVERHGGRQTERLPPNELGTGKTAPQPVAMPVLGPADFNDNDQTVSQHDSEPPPPLDGALPPAEGSDLFAAPNLPPPAGPTDAFAEFESEIAGESTRIEESDLIADQSTAIVDEGPRMPFLFVESGKDKGKEYVLQEGETGVGRGIDNDVILTDVSVSRKHLRVLRDGASLVLKDLGSGNGSTVNGRRVHQVALVEGDRIELGETVLVVRTPATSGEVISVVTAPSATQDTSLPSQDDSFRPMAAPMIPASWPAAPVSGSMDSLPPRDGNTATVRLPRRTLMVAGAAVAVLASMIGATVGVVILSNRSETATPLSTTPVVVVSGPGQTPQTITLPTPAPVAAPVPVAVAPTIAAPVPPVVTAPIVQAPIPAPMPTAVPAPTVGAAPTVAPVVAVAPTPAPSTSRATAPAPSHSPRSPRAPRDTASPAAGATARMLAAYRTGDFDGAAAIARDAASHATGDERRELEQTAGQIDSFASLYPPIHAAGDSVASVARQIPIALNLDRQIAPGGYYARELSPRYVRWLVSSARSQMSSAPAAACGHVRNALDLDSGNSDAQALARQCETAAQRMITDARARETRDAAGARRVYEDVQRMVPRSSASYTAAQERLTAMRRARPVDEDE